MATSEHPSSSLILSYDVWTFIVEKCSRNTLLEVCLVNKVLYNIAVAQLYRDPFGLIIDELSEAGLTRHVPWYNLYRVLEKHPRLATHVRRFISSSKSHAWRTVSEEWMVLPCLHNLRTVEWHDGVHMDAVRLFIDNCPSRGVKSVLLPARMSGQLLPSFWTWLESQRNLKELKLPWGSNPSLIPTVELPKLEALGASPEIAKILLPDRSIRAFDGIGSTQSTNIWSLEDLESVLPLLGAALQSIGGVKVLRRNVAAFLRSVNKWCPFVEAVRVLIDSQGVPALPSFHDLVSPLAEISDAPKRKTDLGDLIPALSGFNCLHSLYLDADQPSTEESAKTMIEKIAKDCATLSFVEWTPIIRHDGTVHPKYVFTIFRNQLVDGLSSCLVVSGNDEYPIV
ncbi:hypothetical protein FRB94_001420 [Tulasnella sp. JGI-2019a]|nr:hypothetical protein FRB94_001420 [Tulasnella sp. JGI-2019a]